MNQYTNPMNEERYREALEKPEWQEHMKNADKELEKAPESCVVWTGSNPNVAQVRCSDGKRVNLSVRKLFWLYKYDELKDFKRSKCGCKGCLNPRHQSFRTKPGIAPAPESFVAE